MIASIKAKGFKYTKNDDLIDGQFTLVSKEIIDSEFSTFTKIRMSESQTFNLFKSNIEYDFLSLTKSLRELRKITRGANDLLIEAIDVSIEKQENGLLATLNIKLSEV